MKRKATVLFFALSMFLGALPIGGGTTEAQLEKPQAHIPNLQELERLAHAADLIVLGHVSMVESHSMIDESGEQKIYSNVALKVEEVLKGETVSDLITFHVDGGSVSDPMVYPLGSAIFKEGERICVFLYWKNGELQVLSGVLGKFSIDDQGAISELAATLEVVRARILSSLDKSVDGMDASLLQSTDTNRLEKGWSAPYELGVS